MIRSRATLTSNRRRGAVAALVAICMVPLIGVMAIAIDGGLMLAARRRAQTVADAAAYSAACQLSTNSTTDPTGLDINGKARAVAVANTKANGFNNDGATNKVEINIPPKINLPKSSPYEGLPGYVEVIITTIQPRYFGAVLGSGSTNVGARAVARVSGSSSSAPPSVLLLNSNKSQALSLSGGTTFTTESTIQVNSSSSTGTSLRGSSTIDTASLLLHGGGDRDNSSRVIGAVQTGVNAVNDPLASLAAPTTAGLANQSFTSTYGSKTISPGVYNNGISIAGGMTVTMQPGVYYIKNSGLTLSGGVTLKGTGVTIYLDNSGGRNNDFSISGGATVNLLPPTSGPYSGLTYFQDRANANALSFSGGTTTSIKGTVYAPAAPISISGGTRNTYGSQLITDSLSLSGGAYVNFNTVTDASSGYVYGGTPTLEIRLVE